VLGGVSAPQIAAAIGLDLTRINFAVPAGDQWFALVNQADAGGSATARSGRAAVALLVDAVAQRLQGDAELSQLAHDLGYAPQPQAGGRSVFLSYSSKNRAEVDRLYDALRRADPSLDVFQDHRCIGPGQAWLDVIRGRAGRASLLACWLTGEFLRSAFVHYEIGIAESQGAKIVPLTVDPQAMRKAPAYLQAKQGIPVPPPVDFDAVAREIIRAV